MIGLIANDSEDNMEVSFSNRIDEDFPEQTFRSEIALLQEIENMEEKIFSASLQVKVTFCIKILSYSYPLLLTILSVQGWKAPAKISKNLSFSNAG